MTQPVPTRDDLVDIVRSLANGLSLQQVTERSELPYAEVQRLATLHGYPNRALMAIAADRLEKGEKAAVRTALAIPRVELDELFADAESIGLGTKAKRIRDLIVQLREDVKGKSELAQAMADLKAAQAKVAALRAGTTPKGKASTTPKAKADAPASKAQDGLDRATRLAIKEWAAANGKPITSPTVPKAIVAAYREQVSA